MTSTRGAKRSRSLSCRASESPPITSWLHDLGPLRKHSMRPVPRPSATPPYEQPMSRSRPPSAPGRASSSRATRSIRPRCSTSTTSARLTSRSRRRSSGPSGKRASWPPPSLPSSARGAQPCTASAPRPTSRSPWPAPVRPSSAAWLAVSMRPATAQRCAAHPVRPSPCSAPASMWHIRYRTARCTSALRRRASSSPKSCRETVRTEVPFRSAIASSRRSHPSPSCAKPRSEAAPSSPLAMPLISDARWLPSPVASIRLRARGQIACCAMVHA